jgi:hypothetical protein
MKGMLNPDLNSGDRVICYYMEGEIGVPPGTTGTVTRVSKDPFEKDGTIINVDWDNGSKLALISVTDSWKKNIEEIKEETGSPEYDFYSKNPELFDHFDWRFLRNYLFKLRESGVINMFHAAPFLYSGKKWIDRYYGEDQEDNDAFQELLEMADEAKDKMIHGLLKYMASKNMEIDDMGRVNNIVQKLAQKINHLYMVFA